jgi:hypothetical protein
MWSTSAILVGALVVGGVASAKAASIYGPASQVISSGPVAKTPSSLKNVPRSLPIRIEIAAIGVQSVLTKVGVQVNGQVVVPLGVNYASWYDRGPTPGAKGSAVIIGHVDSFRGPGIFFNLKNLQAGNVLNVDLADGVKLRFVVNEVARFSKTNFPDQLVYGSHGTRSLQLVTCGGIFNHATGHYESNIVVFSTLASFTKPGLRSSASSLEPLPT